MSRQKSDTADGALQAVRDAKDVAIPEHIAEQLCPAGRLQWGIITRTKAAGLWSENDLELAGELAMCRVEKSKLRKAQQEGDEHAIDSPYESLKRSQEIDRQIETLVKRDVYLTRLLQLHPEATVGKARDQQKKNQRAAEARSVVEDAGSNFAEPLH